MSSKIKHATTLILVVVFLAAVGLPAAVLAHDGDGDQSPEDVKKHARELQEQIQSRVQDKIQGLRQDVKTHTAEVRQKNCETRQAHIDAKIKRFANRATHHKTKLDNFYARITEFHDDRQLSTPNYETLVANVDSAQAGAAAAIEALKSLQITVDCSDPNIADDLVAFREAVSDVRDALKAYRSTLKELLVAVKQSIPTESEL